MRKREEREEKKEEGKGRGIEGHGRMTKCAGNKPQPSLPG